LGRTASDGTLTIEGLMPGETLTFSAAMAGTDYVSSEVDVALVEGAQRHGLALSRKDTDGDGLFDDDDACPTEPETVNGFEDDDGCPDEEPVVAAVEPEPEPVVVAPEPVVVAPEPEPEPVVVAPEPEPVVVAPEPVVVAP